VTHILFLLAANSIASYPHIRPDAAGVSVTGAHLACSSVFVGLAMGSDRRCLENKRDGVNK